MSLLVESIKIFNGKVYNLDFHQKRFDRSRHELFGIESSILLRKIINIPESFKQGLVKCRVVYGQNIESVSFAHYQIRNIQKLKLIMASEPIKYQYKWVERPQLDILYNQRFDGDEIVIVSEDLLTDAYYYNLVFEKQDEFFTPKYPILFGTQRAKLLDQGKIVEADIKVDQLKSYDYVHLINAFTPLGKIKVDLKNLIF